MWGVLVAAALAGGPTLEQREELERRCAGQEPNWVRPPWLPFERYRTDLSRALWNVPEDERADVLYERWRAFAEEHPDCADAAPRRAVSCLAHLGWMAKALSRRVCRDHETYLTALFATTYPHYGFRFESPSHLLPDAWPAVARDVAAGTVRPFDVRELERKDRKVKGRYPDEARARRLGMQRCLVVVRLSRRGVPSGPEVMGCPEVFHRVAQRIALGMRFHPPREGNVRVEAVTVLTVIFQDASAS